MTAPRGHECQLVTVVVVVGAAGGARAGAAVVAVAVAGQWYQEHGKGG